MLKCIYETLALGFKNKIELPRVLKKFKFY